MLYVLDSHVLIWMFGDKSRLGRNAYAAIIAATSSFIIPTIALAEIRYLESRSRIPACYEKIRFQMTRSSKFRIHPVAEEVVDLLPAGFTLHDGLILATALYFRDRRCEDVALITKDAEITASGIVTTIW